MIDALKRLVGYGARSAIPRTQAALRQTLGYEGGAHYPLIEDRFTTDQALTRIVRELTIVSTGMTFYQDMIGQLQWSFEPADDSDQARQAADLATELILEDRNIDWHKVMRRACLYRYFGYSIHEWTFEPMRDGVSRFKEIEPRSWNLLSEFLNGPDGKPDRVWHNGVEIPLWKCLYVTETSWLNNPKGFGLLKKIAPTAAKLAKLRDMELGGYEGDLRGIPVIRYPRQLDELPDDDPKKVAAFSAMDRILSNYSKGNRSRGIKMPSAVYETRDAANRPSSVYEYDITLLTADGQGLAEIHQAIMRETRDIARAMGIESLLLGEGEGSYALAKEKSSQFSAIIDASSQALRYAAQRDIVRPFWEINLFPEDLMPRLEVENANFKTEEELLTIARGTLDMIAQGDPAGNALRAMSGLPLIEDPAELIQPEREERE